MYIHSGTEYSQRYYRELKKYKYNSIEGEQEKSREKYHIKEGEIKKVSGEVTA